MPARERWMTQESRKVPRFAIQLPCKFGNVPHTMEGTALNLSSQGCAITAEHLPAVSTYVSLELDFLNGEAPADIELAAVRWVSGHRCGLEFIKVSPEMLLKLKTFVSILERTP